MKNTLVTFGAGISTLSTSSRFEGSRFAASVATIFELAALVEERLNPVKKHQLSWNIYHTGELHRLGCKVQLVEECFLADGSQVDTYPVSVKVAKQDFDNLYFNDGKIGAKVGRDPFSIEEMAEKIVAALLK